MAKEAEGVPNGIIIDLSKLNLFPDASGVQRCQVTEVLDMYPGWVPKRFRKSWVEESCMNILIGNCDPSVRERLAFPTISKCGVRQPYHPIPLRNDPELAQYYE